MVSSESESVSVYESESTAAGIYFTTANDGEQSASTTAETAPVAEEDITIDINDEEVPLAVIEDEEVVIEDEETPLAANKTEEKPSILGSAAAVATAATAGIGAVAAGAAVAGKKGFFGAFFKKIFKK